MAKKTKRGMWNALKRGMTACALALTLASPNAKPAMAQEANLQNQEQASGSVSLNLGYSDNNIKDRDFSSGFYSEINAQLTKPFNEKGNFESNGKFKAEFLELKRDGKISNYNLDLDAVINRTIKSSSLNFNIGFGANVDFTHSEQTFEGSTIEISNINAGPMINLAIDSKYVDAGLEYRLGFGEAGNTVHGRDMVTKHYLKADIGFEMGPVRVEGYGEGKANVLKIKNVERNDYKLALGAKASVRLIDKLSVEAGYEHDWVLGNLDNTTSDIFNAGIKLRF